MSCIRDKEMSLIREYTTPDQAHRTTVFQLYYELQNQPTKQAEPEKLTGEERQKRNDYFAKLVIKQD